MNPEPSFPAIRPHARAGTSVSSAASVAESSFAAACRRHQFGLLAFVLNIVAGLALTAGFARADTATFHPGHYEQRAVAGGSVATNPVPDELRGVQIMYTWKQLQPSATNPAVYDFSLIDQDLAALGTDQRLIIQVQYKAFNGGNRAPTWLMNNSGYGGGVYQCDDNSWNVVMWNANVRAALRNLYDQLAAAYGGNSKVEAVNIPESLAPKPLGFRTESAGNTGNFKNDFNYALRTYEPNKSRSIDDFVDNNTSMTSSASANMINLKDAFAAFPGKPIIAYLNFDNDGLLVPTAKANGIGIAGPDLVVNSPSSLNGTTAIYHRYPGFAGLTPVGVAMQPPDWTLNEYNDLNDFGQVVSAREVYIFARDNLKANYIFWNLPTNSPAGYNRKQEVIDLMNDDRAISPVPADTGTPGLSGGLATQIPQSLPGAPDIPAAPENLTAATNADGTITLQWTHGTGGAARTGYRIERKQVPVIPDLTTPNNPNDTIEHVTGPYLEIATVNAGATSFDDLAPESNMKYHYIVRATGGEGDSPYAYRAIATSGTVIVDVSVAATDPDAAEAGSDPGTFTFTRSGSTASPLTVNFTVGGTATSGNDYADPGTSVTFAAGASTATVNVTPVEDTLSEGNETVIVTLAAGAGYTAGSPDSATVTIADSDMIAPEFTSLTASPDHLWPANHKMVAVTLAANVTDNLDPAPATRILSVASSESANGAGDGNTAVDWEITGDLTLNLRAERSGSGPGRIYTVTVESMDAAGNRSTAAVLVPVAHNNDTQAPTVALTGPADSALVGGTGVPVSATASDNDGVVGVQFRLDGVNLGVEDTSAPYEISWNTTTATSGTHVLTAVARDDAGNTTTSAGVTVQVDNVPPAVALDVPAAGAQLEGANVTVTATATDNVGVAGVQFRLDGVNLGAEITAAPYAIMWDTTAVADGSHTLSAVARDMIGNLATSAATVVVDNTPPAVAVTAPAAGATVGGASVTVSADATDLVGVIGVQFQLDGMNLGAEDTVAPYDLVWNASASSDGSHTLTAVARDAIGHVTASAPVVVTVNNAPPPVAATFQAEAMLPPAASSGDEVSPYPAGSPKRVDYQSDAVGDFITFQATGIVAGTYTVTVRMQKGPGRGIIQIESSPTLDGTYAPIGAPRDTYNSANPWVIYTVSGVPLTAGDRYFRFRVTGKNSAANNYRLSVDYIQLTP